MNNLAFDYFNRGNFDFFIIEQFTFVIAVTTANILSIFGV